MIGTEAEAVIVRLHNILCKQTKNTFIALPKVYDNFLKLFSQSRPAVNALLCLSLDFF